MRKSINFVMAVVFPSTVNRYFDWTEIVVFTSSVFLFCLSVDVDRLVTSERYLAVDRMGRLLMRWICCIMVCGMLLGQGVGGSL